MPNLPERVAPAAANWSSPTRRHTATPSAAAPDDRRDAPHRYSPLQTLASPASPRRGEQRNKGDPPSTRPARSAAADTLAPGCTRKNSASRSLLCAVYRRRQPELPHRLATPPPPLFIAIRTKEIQTKQFRFIHKK